MNYLHEFHIYSLIKVDPEIKQHYDRVKSSLDSLAAKNSEIILTYKDGTRKVNAGRAFYFYSLEGECNKFVGIENIPRIIGINDRSVIYGSALLMPAYSLKLDRLLTIKYWGKKLRNGYWNAPDNTLVYENDVLLNISGMADYENKKEPQPINLSVTDIKNIHELIRKYWLNSLYVPSNLETLGTLFHPQSNTFVISMNNFLELIEIFATILVSVPDSQDIEILSFNKEKSEFRTEKIEMENAKCFTTEVPSLILLFRDIFINGNEGKKKVTLSALPMRKAKNLTIDFFRNLLNLILRTFYVNESLKYDDPVYVTDLSTLKNAYDYVIGKIIPTNKLSSSNINIKIPPASSFLNSASPEEALYKLDDEGNVVYLHPILRFPLSITSPKEYNTYLSHLKNFIKKRSERMKILDQLKGRGNNVTALLSQGNYDKSRLPLVRNVKSLVAWRNLVKEVGSRIESSSVIR